MGATVLRQRPSQVCDTKIRADRDNSATFSSRSDTSSLSRYDTSTDDHAKQKQRDHGQPTKGCSKPVAHHCCTHAHHPRPAAYASLSRWAIGWRGGGDLAFNPTRLLRHEARLVTDGGLNWATRLSRFNPAGRYPRTHEKPTWALAPCQSQLGPIFDERIADSFQLAGGRRIVFIIRPSRHHGLIYPLAFGAAKEAFAPPRSEAGLFVCLRRRESLGKIASQAAPQGVDELCMNLGDAADQAAWLCWGGMTSMPSANLTPATIFGN